MMASRYAHAKQFKRHHHQLRLLRSRLGRIIRDIRRKIAGRPVLEAAFEAPLARAAQIRSQQQRQRGRKLYSFHAPEVECIGKGKASAPYEFGVKGSIVTTNARAPGGQFVLRAYFVQRMALWAVSRGTFCRSASSTHRDNRPIRSASSPDNGLHVSRY
jgi:transposase, IS5 family